MTYLRLFCIAILFIWGTVAAINWAVDPYGMYWSPATEGLNKLKPKSGNRVRFTKPYRVEDANPEVLLVGNSRIEMGLAAESDHFSGRRVYNMGMPGVGLQRQLQNAAQQIQHNDNLKLVILSLDYLDFLYRPESWAEKLEKAREPENLLVTEHDGLSVAKTFLGYFLSLDTLFNSFATLFQQEGDHNSITLLGTNVADGYLSVMRYEGIKPLFVQKIDQIKQTFSNQPGYFSSSAHGQNPGLVQLIALAKLADHKRVKMIFFISPYHYSYLHLIGEHGCWRDYLSWKKQLTLTMTEEYPDVSLWDFSGFNRFTLEPVVFSKPHQLMKWYWEPSHYRVELGEKMLSILLEKAPPGELGRLMTAGNIEQLLHQDGIGLEQSREQWKALQGFLYD